MSRRKARPPLERRRPSRTATVDAARSVGPRKRAWSEVAVCAFIVLAVIAVFAQTARYDFVNCDDNVYVYENPRVLDGLTWRGVAWAFRGFYVCNWHPLTWLSHMLDWQLFGAWAGGHHITSAAIHASTAILLFLVLRSMTASFWPSAMVAAVFAVHPLRAESVAWIAERKDVLSGLFFVLTLAAYAGYARRPFSLWRYGLVVAALVLGLLSKPMLVTAPCVLLLLDYWPLGRFGSRHAPPAAASDGSRSVPASWRRLLVEKLPLFLLVAASCVTTRLAQSGSIVSVELLPIPVRIGNAAVSYVAYVGQMFYPANLAVFYPHATFSLPIWRIVMASIVFVGVSLAAVLLRRRMPYLFVGWFWYVGMLVPVIGLVQVGVHAMADRYTYLPQIGLYIAVAWGVADCVALVPFLRRPCQLVAVALLSLLIVVAWRQTGYWRDSFTLWQRDLVCAGESPLAHISFAHALAHRGEADAAVEHYQAALSINSRSFQALNNLGIMLAREGKLEKASEYFAEALRYSPNDVEVLCNLGSALVGCGKTSEALEHLRLAVELRPDLADAHGKYGVGLLVAGDVEGAVKSFRMAIDLDRRYADAHNNLSLALTRQGKLAEAVQVQREYLRLRPNDVGMLNGFAWTLATHPDASIRNGSEAVELAQRAVQLTRAEQPAVLGTLAAAYAEAGRFTEASQTARQAAELASRQNHPGLAETIREKLALYDAKTPFREPAAANASSPKRP